MRATAPSKMPVSKAPGPNGVERAIARAARATAIDFEFLVAQAEVESAKNPDARARGSSATGLYQFIESTWLETMQRHGPRFGMGDIAARIVTSPQGSADVPDVRQRKAILELRNDPEVAALMAAGLAEDNRAHLMPILGRQPNHSELYLAHFLGAGGAARFLTEMGRDPLQDAASLFRRPAAANPNIFYSGNGEPRSLGGVMEHLSAKIERARAGGAPKSTTAEWEDTAPGDDAWPDFVAERAVFDPSDSLADAAQTDRFSPLRFALPEAPSLRTRRSSPSMSSVLSATFGEDPASLGRIDTNDQARRAYDRLRALGL